MELKVSVSVLLLLTIVLTGCIGGEEPELEQDPEEPEEPTADTGMLTGKVVGEWSFEPLQATVAVTDGEDVVAEKQADSAGQFSFTLEPGGYRLLVTDSCCRNHVEDVNVGKGETTEISIMLKSIKTDAPFVERDQWTGFIACSATFYGAAFPGIPNPTEQVQETCDEIDSEADRTHRFTVREGIQSIVFAMDWDGEMTTTSCFFAGVTGVYIDQNNLTVDVEPSELGAYPLHYLRMSLVHVDTGIRYTTLDGGAPLNGTIGPKTGAPDIQLHNVTEEIELEFRVAGSSGWCGASYQQQFTIYYELHYWEAAPEDANALPDS